MVLWQASTPEQATLQLAAPHDTGLPQLALPQVMLHSSVLPSTGKHPTSPEQLSASHERKQRSAPQRSPTEHENGALQTTVHSEGEPAPPQSTPPPQLARPVQLKSQTAPSPSQSLKPSPARSPEKDAVTLAADSTMFEAQLPSPEQSTSHNVVLDEHAINPPEQETSPEQSMLVSGALLSTAKSPTQEFSAIQRTSQVSVFVQSIRFVQAASASQLTAHSAPAGQRMLLAHEPAPLHVTRQSRPAGHSVSAALHEPGSAQVNTHTSPSHAPPAATQLLPAQPSSTGGSPAGGIDVDGGVAGGITAEGGADGSMSDGGIAAWPPLPPESLPPESLPPGAMPPAPAPPGSSGASGSGMGSPGEPAPPGGFEGGAGVAPPPSAWGAPPWPSGRSESTSPDVSGLTPGARVSTSHAPMTAAPHATIQNARRAETQVLDSCGASMSPPR